MSSRSSPQRDPISTIAHDLRSPLSVIVGLASRERESATGATRDALDKILDESLRASRMLENRAAVAKLETGPVLPREWIAVEELVGASLARLEARLEGRQVTIEVGEILAHVDATLGGLVVVNLVDNATRHTPRGTAIEITARRDGTSTIIEVTDHGPGPAAPRGDTGDTTAGSGQGLAVSRRLAAAYDGTLELLARPGGGAIARLTVPDAGPYPDEAGR